MNRPEPPKFRIKCNFCGDITETTKHTNWFCRFAGWLDERKKKKEKQKELKLLLNYILSDDKEKAREQLQKVTVRKIKEIEDRNNPFWH